MTNANDRKIIEKLSKASAMEMNTHELEDILKNELKKPAEEIDPKLVDDLMEILQPEEFSAAQQKKIWKNIQKKLSPKTNHRRLIRRLTAIAALFVLLFGVTLMPANAFHWQFLSRLLKPVTETFGIYLNYFDNKPAETPEPHEYGVSADEATPVMYYDLSTFPTAYEGYAIQPSWIPDGFVFGHASWYSEVHMQKFALHYFRGEEELNITITIHTDPEAVANYEFERATDIPEEKLIGSSVVAFYHNYQNSIVPQHASWIDGNASYSIRCAITDEELEHLIASYTQRTTN